MKKTLLLLFFCCNTLIIAQTIQGSIDQKNINWSTSLQNLSVNQINSGILYDKITSFTNLISYNRNEYNTADYEMFNQSISELYRASDQTKFISSSSLTSLLSETISSNTADIGIINSTFQFLNYNENTPSDGGLIFQNGIFTPIANKPSFLTKKVLICSPLKKYIVGSNAVFNFKNNLIFNNSTSNINQLIVDFGDGTSSTIINNGVLVLASVAKNYTTSGNKILTFTATFNDNSTMITYGKINFIYQLNNSFLTNTTTQPPCYESLRDKSLFTSTIPYQGYEESSPVFGKIEYYTFYHTNNNNTLKKVIKPIIIIDGFDPGDTRKVKDCDCVSDPDCSNLDKYKDDNGNFNPQLHTSIEDMMYYNDVVGGNTVTRNLIQVLRDLGYDVIIINNPTYTTTNGAGQTVKIDGGADYIERNAMNIASFIQYINGVVSTNGSSEKLVIVGPSMGGQISRYALAYMDKKYAETNDNLWKHNARLWISVDSPHLGANIPLSLQANVFCLGYVAGNNEAKDKYDLLLNSVAARQQLLYQFNAFENESPHNSLYTNYYNNLNSNGVPGSNGFPLTTSNFRKVALVNGSLDGNNTNDDTGSFFAYEKQKYMDIRGYIDLSFLFWHWSVTTFRNVNKFMPNTGGSAEIYKYTQFLNLTTFTADNHYYFNITNNDIHGNLDIIPGGMLNSQVDLQESILKGLSSAHQRSDYSDLFSNHSFIPVFSSLGHLQPNQNWGSSLNYNLKCSSNNLTPFDSYYGESLNTRHTTFNKESVAWLLKELSGQPQAPHFPIQENVLTGPSKICANNNTTYSISDVCKVPSPVMYTQGGNVINGWSVQGNLQIVSTTPYSITVVGTSDDPNDATITATFQNGQTIQIPVHVGTPKAENTIISNSWDWVSINGGSYNMSVPADPTATSYYWTAEADVSEFPMMCPTINAHHGVFIGGINSGNISSITTTTPTATINWGNCLGTYILTCYAVNDCGMTPYSVKFTTVGKPQNNPCTHKPYGIKIAPNPIESGRTNFVVSKIRDASPCNFAKIEEGYVPKTYVFYEKSSAMVSIYDFSGNRVYSNVFPEPEYIEIKELPKEDETNPEEVKKYEELNHYNIQGLDLNPGFYFIRVKDSDGDSEGATVQVEVK